MSTEDKKPVPSDTMPDGSRPHPNGGSFPREFGHYTLLGELGHGAMGIVYEARDRNLDRTVALKVLRVDLDPNSPALERFKREARATSQVRHENVVEIYEAGEAEGRPYYAMALLGGKSLAALAADGEMPDPRELCRGLAGVADALQALHDKGIVHRDVKPSNIMVEPDGRMVLADFGLVRTAADSGLTQTGEALGTPRYMSPEQALGNLSDVDGRSDVYALGATLYEALSGKQLFESTDSRSMIRMILTERPTPLRHRAPGLPVECDQVAMKALEKRKEDRYPTAAALRDDLLAVAESRAVEGRPVSAARRLVRRYKWAGLAAAVLIAIVVLTASWMGSRPATLTLMSHPPARAFLDGVDLGMTPVTTEAGPGGHVVVMRLPGFKEMSHRMDLEPGERRTFERVLLAENPEDPMALAQLASSLSVPEVTEDRLLSLSATWQPGGEGALAPLKEIKAPRGAPPPFDCRVRKEDLADLDFAVLKSFGGPGSVEVRKGGETLYRQDVGDAKAGPVDLSGKVEEGDLLTVVFRRQKGPPIVARMHVVPDRCGHQVAELAARLKDNDPRVLAHMKSRLFLSNGLDYAALKEAWKVASESKDSEYARAVIAAAMEMMNLKDPELRRNLEAQGIDLDKERVRQVLLLKCEPQQAPAPK